jgi:hypothetical protein
MSASNHQPPAHKFPDGYPAPFCFGAEEFEGGYLLVPFKRDEATGAWGTQCVFCLTPIRVRGTDQDLIVCRAIRERGWGLLPIAPLQFHAVCPFCLANPHCMWGPFSAAEICQPLSPLPDR